MKSITIIGLSLTLSQMVHAYLSFSIREPLETESERFFIASQEFLIFGFYYLRNSIKACWNMRLLLLGIIFGDAGIFFEKTEAISQL